MKSTPEQIERLVTQFGFTLTDLPTQDIDAYAYEQKDRDCLWSMAQKWSRNELWGTNSGLEDFMCHQSDVIEILVSCLAQATHKAVWIKMTGMMPPEYTGHYECSNCKWHGSHHDNTIETRYKYCPNCGAKMENAV